MKRSFTCILSFLYSYIYLYIYLSLGESSDKRDGERKQAVRNGGECFGRDSDGDGASVGCFGDVRFSNHAETGESFPGRATSRIKRTQSSGHGEA